MSNIEMKIEELEKRVAELEKQVQPVDINKITEKFAEEYSQKSNHLL
ncbi:hypothetical protein [Clostridium peptidivorans]|nr:hypothetical protein [Clostridium peptidivorans]